MNSTQRKHILVSLILGMLCLGGYAQQQSPKTDRVAFSRWDLGFSAGTTGFGVDLCTPLTSWMRVRSGVNYMPRWNVPMTFGLESFDVEGIDTKQIPRMQELMLEYFGIEVDKNIKMSARSTMLDFKLLADFYPFRDKRWHITAGFYWGASKVGHIENTTRDMTTLVGIVMYNKFYDYFTNEEYMDKPLYNDLYIDPDVGDKLRDKFLEFGRVGVHLGDFKGTDKPYVMEPGKDCMVQANAYVNHFKPYLGFGYERDIRERWTFGFDVGALFWGGVPNIITHPNLNLVDANGEPQTVDLTKDVVGVTGKVGGYVDVAKALKVMPNLSIRFAYKL